jgi:hypothetical protein
MCGLISCSLSLWAALYQAEVSDKTSSLSELYLTESLAWTRNLNPEFSNGIALEFHLGAVTRLIGH